MSFRVTALVCTLTVKIGEQFSQILQGDDTTGDAYAILIVADANAVYPGNIQVCGKGRATISDTFADLLLLDGTLVTIPKANQAIQYIDPVWPSWRIKTNAPVTNDVTYSVWKLFA